MRTASGHDCGNGILTYMGVVDFSIFAGVNGMAYIPVPDNVCHRFTIYTCILGRCEILVADLGNTNFYFCFPKLPLNQKSVSVKPPVSLPGFQSHPCHAAIFIK